MDCVENIKNGEVFELECLHDFYTGLRKKGVLFCFCGPTSQAVIEGIGDALKQKMQLEEANVGLTQRIFGIFVEQMQNILNYSSERMPVQAEEPMSLGMVAVGKEQRNFYVICGNYIDRAAEEPLKEKIRIIQSMDKHELKAYFKEQRRLDPEITSKGAGLGFIEIARKASEPIEYRLDPISETHSFFAIKAVV